MSEQKEWLAKMYQETLQESRFNTFKRLNTLIIALFILLFMNLLFTPPNKIINIIFLVLAVVSVLIMFYRLTQERVSMKSLPDDMSHMDGETIRNSIDQIRDQQYRIRWQMGLFIIPFFLYFLIDLAVSATVEVDKLNLVLKILFFFLLLGVYYFMFFRIRKSNFVNTTDPAEGV